MGEGSSAFPQRPLKQYSSVVRPGGCSRGARGWTARTRRTGRRTRRNRAHGIEPIRADADRRWPHASPSSSSPGRVSAATQRRVRARSRMRTRTPASGTSRELPCRNAAGRLPDTTGRSDAVRPVLVDVALAAESPPGLDRERRLGERAIRYAVVRTETGGSGGAEIRRACSRNRERGLDRLPAGAPGRVRRNGARTVEHRARDALRSTERAPHRPSELATTPSSTRRPDQSSGGGGARTVRLPLCSGALTTPSRSICSIRRAARL